VRVSESLGFFSIERFLTGDEVREILRVVQEHRDTLSQEELHETERATSVHYVPEVSLSMTMAAYEPHGRVEITPLPATAEKILADAVDRALPAVRRVFPSARRGEAWTYLEYGPDQHITAHIDHPVEIADDGAHVVGLSILLSDDFEGGDFVLETSSSPELWRDDRPEFTREGADHTSDWFPAVATTKWRARPSLGTAVLYGTQLIHGTDPVRQGCAKKIIGFLAQ
jgi:alkylated DNA repair dioxygenase AlkB